ncbi:SMP-30/gluconolactonase/LRE family protein [Streptomyces sp. NPDC055025]
MTSSRTWRARTAGVVLGALVGAGLAVSPSAAAAVTVVNCPSSACTQVAGGLGEPVGSAYDANGHAYITYQNGDLREVELATGATSTVARGLGNLRGIDLDGEGGAYVGDFDGNLLKVDLGTGSRELLASGLGPLHAIVHSAGTTYATGGSGKLYELAPGGSVRVVASGLGLSQGIALDGEGKAYTADMFTGRILETVLATGAVRSVAKEFYEPTSISVAADGLVYFSVGDQVTRLDPATGRGTHIATVRGLNSVIFRLDGDGNAYAAQVTGGGSLWKIKGLTRLP